MRPRMGFGLLGTFLFVPGVIFGLCRCFAPQRTDSGSQWTKIFILVLMTCGTFLLGHILLRWQSIGIVRIMPLFLMAGAPLSAPLLEKSCMRIVGITLLGLSGIMLATLSIGSAARRWNCEKDVYILRNIGKLQKNHNEFQVDYIWLGQTTQRVILKDNIIKTLYATFMSRISQPTVFGFVGGVNSSFYYLSGRDFDNIILPLTDTRKPDQFFEPSDYIEYIVFDDYKSGRHWWVLDSEIDKWCLKRGYLPFFKANNSGKCFFAVFKKMKP
jgi:hypothetical protein